MARGGEQARNAGISPAGGDARDAPEPQTREGTASAGKASAGGSAAD